MNTKTVLTNVLYLNFMDYVNSHMKPGDTITVLDFTNSLFKKANLKGAYVPNINKSIGIKVSKKIKSGIIKNLKISSVKSNAGLNVYEKI